MTAEEADSQLSTATVKPAVELKPDESNIPTWQKHILGCCLNKRCHMALFKQYPETAVDAAAMEIIMVSLPDHFKNAVSRFATAHDAFHYFLDKFTGGKNPEANLVWQKELEAGMKHDETLEQYVMRVESLYDCMRGNGAIVAPYQVFKLLVNGLPEELDHCKLALHGNMAGKTVITDALPALRHMAFVVDFNDRLPRTPASANKAHLGGSQASAGSSSTGGHQNCVPEWRPGGGSQCDSTPRL